jgi:thiamine transport system permease protein
MAAGLDSDRFALKNTAGTMRRSSWLTLLLWAGPLAFLALFYFYPLASILQVSLARGKSGPIQPFIDALSSPGMRRVIWFTIWQALLSTLLTLLVGLPGAFLLARYRFPGKSLIRAITGISFVLPTLVVAAAFNALLGPRGWVNLTLMGWSGVSSPPIQFTNTLLAILVAHVFYNTTIVLRTVGDFWAHLDPRVEQAARILGANRWQTLKQVTLPLIAPAISVAAMLVFIFDFTSFGVILVLGGPRFSTLEVEIYNQTISLFNLPLAAALAIIQLVFTLALTVTYTRLSERLARPMNLRPQEYALRRLDTWFARLLAGAYLAFLLGLLTLPLLALIGRSFFRLDVGQGGQVAIQFTTAYYQELTVNRQQSLFYVPPTTAIAVSLTYATLTVIMALSMGLLASWALVRERSSRLNHMLDPLLMLPLGTSAVTLGLGFIVALDRPPLDLRTSILLIPLAHSLVAFPFAVRSLAPSLGSIRPRLRQAAAVLGASPWRVFRLVDLPLVGRALLVAATFAFTISLGEFGATALIARPEYPTIPVMIYRFLSYPGAMNYGQALALSVILCIVTAAGILLIERFRIADIGEF